MAPRVEISKRLVLVNTASAILAKTINLSVILWLNQYIVRRAGMEEFALLPMLVALIVLVPLITSILTAGIGRYVMEAYAQGNDRGVTQIVSTMTPLLAVTGVFILTGGFAFAWYIDHFLTVLPDRLWDARLMMALLVVAAAVKPPCMAFSVGFFVQQRFVLQNLINVGGELLRLTLLCLLLFGLGPRVLWVVVANVATELVVSAVTMAISMRLIPALRFRRHEIQWGRARELLVFGGWSLLGYIAYRLREATVLFFLNRYAALADVTIFTFGYVGRRQIDAWMDTMGSSLYSVVTGMHALGAKERIRSIYLRGGRLVLWITLFFAMPAALYARPIMRLYAGQACEEAAVAMVLTLAGLPITGGTWMIWQVANATGRVRSPNLYALCLQLTTIPLVFWVVHLLRSEVTVAGLVPAGVGLVLFAVGAIPEFLVLWRLGLKLSGATFDAWARETLVPGLAPACLGALVWSALNVIVSPQGLVPVGLCLLAGAVCYVTVLLVFCLEPRDREDLATLVARIKKAVGRGPGVSGPTPGPVGPGPAAVPLPVGSAGGGRA